MLDRLGQPGFLAELQRVADRRGAAFGFLPRFLPSERGHVQEAVGEVDMVQAPGISRVRVEDFAALAQEAARAGQLGRPRAAE